MKNILSLSLLSALVLTSCSKKDEQAEQAEQAAQAVEQMGQAMQGMQAGDAAPKAPGVAIPAKTLVTFLPTVSGFEKNGDAEYMDMEMQGTKYSHASQSFTSGEKSVKVSLFDYNNIAGLSMAFGAFLNMNMETNDEIMRSQKTNGFPGWFNWHKKNNNGTIGVVINDRVFATIEGSGGVTESELQSVAESINFSGIAGEVK